jgi:AcrR family transcriptional regulator
MIRMALSSTANSAARKPAPRKRRSQAERSDAMRTRLIRATLDCIARDGYAGTTVSSIVKRAGVSRGAHVHHYPSKDALILDAAEYLLRRAYRILGEVLLSIADEDDRLQALMKTVWEEIYDTPMFRAFFELLMAGQHDAELARALRAIMARFQQTTDKAIFHYFEPRGAGSEDLRDLFMMTTIMFGAMSVGAQLAQGPQEARRYLDIWTRLMGGQMRARRGVRTPPPRPPDWNRAPGG